MAGTAGETAAESSPARPGDAPTVVAPKAGARAKRGRPVVSPAASQDPEAPGPATATPGSAVPLAARLAPTAEPVRATASLDEEAGTDAEEAGADTSENDVAEPGTGRPDAEATFEPEPGREISADRLGAPAFGAGPGSPVAPAAGDLPAVVAAQSPALGPSTPAGARPRFPPAPAVADMRATPVGAPLRGANGAAGEEMLAADAGVATTRRRAGERPSEADDGDSGPHAGGSAIRLLIAAVVIVAVLIFIATRVFGSGSTPKAAGPPPATVTVAVLNGTHSPGLAGQVAAVLTGLGFKRGLVGNALSQGHRSTLVGYVTPASRAAALTVAKDLVPTPTRVGPVDAATLAVAEAQGGTPDVVVTIGSRYTGR
jgi:hypothetical protein